MNNEKILKKENEDSAGQRNLRFVVIGTGVIFIVILIGAVVIMGSMLRQFTMGKRVLSTAGFSEHALGALMIRDTPIDSDDFLFSQEGISIRNVSRTTLLASTTIRVYIPGDYIPAITCFGVVMDENGYIITGLDAAKEGAITEVELYDGRRFRAELIGSDIKTDLAVMKIEAENLRTAAFGNSDMREGDRVIYIDLGSNGISLFSEGIIGGSSGAYINTPSGHSYMNITATDRISTSVYTGGVVINPYGQIIGFRYAKFNDLHDFAYVISVTDVKKAVNSIIDNGYVTNRYSLGFEGETVGEALASAAGYNKGVMVINIDKNSDLKNKDIRQGDIITALSGITVSTVDELESVLLQQNTEEVLLQIYRPADKSNFELAVLLIEDTGLLSSP